MLFAQRLFRCLLFIWYQNKFVSVIQMRYLVCLNLWNEDKNVTDSIQNQRKKSNNNVFTSYIRRFSVIHSLHNRVRCMYHRILRSRNPLKKKIIRKRKEISKEHDWWRNHLGKYLCCWTSCTSVCDVWTSLNSNPQCAYVFAIFPIHSQLERLTDRIVQTKVLFLSI